MVFEYVNMNWFKSGYPDFSEDFKTNSDLLVTITDQITSYLKATEKTATSAKSICAD